MQILNYYISKPRNIFTFKSSRSNSQLHHNSISISNRNQINLKSHQIKSHQSRASKQYKYYSTITTGAFWRSATDATTDDVLGDDDDDLGAVRWKSDEQQRVRWYSNVDDDTATWTMIQVSYRYSIQGTILLQALRGMIYKQSLRLLQETG